MSKMERKKTTWTVSPTRKKVIIRILSVNTELGLCVTSEESAHKTWDAVSFLNEQESKTIYSHCTRSPDSDPI